MDSIKPPLVQLKYIQLDEFEAVRGAFSANAALVNEPVNQPWKLVAGQVIFLEPVSRCPNQKCPQWADQVMADGLRFARLHRPFPAASLTFVSEAANGRLPKMRLGKILRAITVKVADGETVNTPTTIDDPTILGEIKIALQTLGLELLDWCTNQTIPDAPFQWRGAGAGADATH